MGNKKKDCFVKFENKKFVVENFGEFRYLDFLTEMLNIPVKGAELTMQMFLDKMELYKKLKKNRETDLFDFSESEWKIVKNVFEMLKEARTLPPQFQNESFPDFYKYLVSLNEK